MRLLAQRGGRWNGSEDKRVDTRTLQVVRGALDEPAFASPQPTPVFRGSWRSSSLSGSEAPGFSEKTRWTLFLDLPLLIGPNTCYSQL